jgi:hypothetical protein
VFKHFNHQLVMRSLQLSIRAHGGVFKGAVFFGLFVSQVF